MGMIRVLLAIAVVFQHSYGTMFQGGYMAVQLFFVVSGFVISFILVELQSYQTVWGFYKNRVLRLFPVYYVVALGTLALYLGLWVLFKNPPPPVEAFLAIDPFGQAMLALVNIIIIGQDWIMFTAVHDGVLHFHYDFLDSEVLAWQGLLVPPAWSLGVELTFYIIAPFILHRFRLLLVLLALSVAVRLYLMSQGLSPLDQWNYRFFPSELAFFIIGALSHQKLMPFLRANNLLTTRSAAWMTYVFVALVTVFITFDVPFHRWTMIAVFTVSLPFLFHFQKANRWDRWVGELSYPIYIVHWVVLYVVNVAWDRLSGTPGYQGMDETLVVLVLSVIAAWVLKTLVADRVENLRNRVRAGAQTGLTSKPAE